MDGSADAPPTEVAATVPSFLLFERYVRTYYEVLYSVFIALYILRDIYYQWPIGEPARDRRAPDRVVQ